MEVRWTQEVQRPLLSLSSSDDLQEEKENLNDVDVDGESGEHVLLRIYRVLPVPDKKLRVIGQELDTT